MLGLRVGGGRGRGRRLGRCFEPVDEEPFPFGGGGSMGMKVWGTGNAGIDMAGGEGGGDGVVDVERKVGPRGVDSADSGESRIRSGTIRSRGCDIGRARDLRGCG